MKLNRWLVGLTWGANLIAVSAWWPYLSGPQRVILVGWAVFVTVLHFWLLGLR
jgi:hypothetical protein